MSGISAAPLVMAPIGAAGWTPVWIEFKRLFQPRLLHVAALSLALGSSEVLSGMAMARDVYPDGIGNWVGVVIVNRLLLTLPVVVVLSALQSMIPRAGIRRPAMVVCVFAASVPICLLFSSDLVRDVRMVAASWPLFLYLLWTSLAAGVLLAVLYEWQWTAEQVLESVRAVRVANDAAERITLESRLNAMQARIDPQLLFAVIDRAQALYSGDAEAAERLLERLIEFLRATLPSRAQAAVTLGQEIALCRSYLELQSLLRPDGLGHDERVSPAIAAMYFPPSVLLPLLQSLLPAHGGSVPAVRLRAIESPSGLAIELGCTPAASPPERDALGHADVILGRFFGDRASIDLRSSPDCGAILTVEVKHAAS